jgi:Bacterial Ig domain
MKYAAAVAMGSRVVRALARGFARSCAHAMILTLTMVATSAAHAQSISVVGAATFDNPFPSPTGALTVQAVAGQTPLPPNVVWTLLSGPAPVTLASTPLSPSGQATLASFTPTTSQGVRLSACLQGGTTCAFFRLVGCWNGSASYNGGLAGTINTTQSSDYGITLYDTLTVGNVSGAGDLPRSGVVTTWSVGAGSGSITPITSVSDANGVARTRHTLGPAIGTQTVTATFSGSRVCASGSNSIRLDVTATAPTNALPTATFALPATGASITAGSTLPIRITARDTDGSIARVVLSVDSGTETTLAPFPVTLSSATTGTDGYDYSWTNVPAGTYTLSAVAYDNSNTPSAVATRTVTINPQACIPVTFVQVSGSGQSGLVGTTLPEDYVVRLKQASTPAGGNSRKATADGIPADVVFTANNGNVTVATVRVEATVGADTRGEARTRHTLGATAGRQTVTATVSGIGLCPVAPSV